MTGTIPDSEPASPPAKDNWQVLSEQTRLFAQDQVSRHYWRGNLDGVLPDGFDADSIADHAVAEVCAERSRHAPLILESPADSELPALLHESQRRVRQHVDRLRRRKENFLLVNEPDLAPVHLDDGEHISPIELVEDPSPHPDQQLAQNEAAAEWEQFKRDFHTFLAQERQLQHLFACLCDGARGQKALASRLRLSPGCIRNLQKQLKRRLLNFFATSAERQKMSHNTLISNLLDTL